MRRSILICLALVLNAYAIGQYDFNTTLEAYQNLVNPISLNNSSPWDNSSIYPIYFNFDFHIGPQTFTAVNVLAGSGLAFPGQGNIQLKVFRHPDSGDLLEDRDQLNSASPIGYEISGIPGEQILKIEWENAGFREWCASSDPNDFVDFQIWLFEGTNKIEVHFGDHMADAGAYGQPDCNSGTDGTQFLFEFDVCNNALSCTGNANLPSYDFRDHCIWQPGVHVSGTPSSGIVYNLTPAPTAINERIRPDIQLFPNPSTSQLIIGHDQLSIDQIVITGTAGKVIKRITSNANVIDISDLSNGIYFIHIILDDLTVSRKFIKK